MPKYEPHNVSGFCTHCRRRKSDHDSLGFCKNPLSARAQSKPADPLHEDKTQEIKQILGSLSQCVQRMTAEFETVHSLRDKIISLDRKINPPVYQVDMQQPSGNSPGPRPTDLGMNGEKMEKDTATTTVDESRLAPTAEAFKSPENHLFRKAYRKLSPEEMILMDALKDKANELAQLIGQANELAQLIGQAPKGREASLGMTNLEQSVMWTVKAITG